MFICVCSSLCTIVAHNTAQNRPDNFPSCPPDAKRQRQSTEWNPALWLPPTENHSLTSSPPDFCGIGMSNSVCIGSLTPCSYLYQTSCSPVLYVVADYIVFCGFWLLSPPCVADADIIFLSCGFFFYLLSSFFPRLISAVADWMSTILLHKV